MASEEAKEDSTLAGLLNRQNFLPDGGRKIDKDELALVEKIVFAALVDDPHEVILSRPCVRHNPVNRNYSARS